MQNGILPGIYGKLPVLGDFVSRRLPAQFVGQWDAWLRNSMAASKEQLGDQWLDIYLNSPIWRFIVSPGCCGERGSAGIVMPSVDRVGRYFPLTLAVVFDAPVNPLPQLLASVSDWFNELEELALSALEDDVDLDHFDKQLQALSFMHTGPETRFTYKAQEREGVRNHLVFRIDMGKNGEIHDALIHLGSHLLDCQLPVYSLWSTSGSLFSNPSISIFKGMPPAGAYLDFLTGRCQPVEGGGKSVQSIPLPSFEVQAPSAVETLHHEENTGNLDWHSWGHSAMGKIRTTNEDAFIERPEIGLWAVADGMGGHSNGAAASRSIVEALQTLPGSDDMETCIHHITDCLQQVNAALLASADSTHPDRIVGSTIVAMVAAGRQCASIWAGDSRLYRYRNGLLSQLTHDHSLAADMYGAERTAPSGAGTGVIQNVVTRAVGAGAELNLDTVRYEAKPGDIFVLCSDGLVKEIHPEEIVEILGTGECEKQVKALIDLALSRGARDNVTAIVVHAGQNT